MSSDNGTVIPIGPALSLRVYHINGRTLGSPSSIVNKLEDYKNKFNKSLNVYEGFGTPKINGNLVEVEYFTGQQVNIYSKNNGSLTSEPVFSQGKCVYIIHPKEKYLECRHTSWVAKKGLNLLIEALGVKFDAVMLDRKAMIELCESAKQINYVSISGIDETDDDEDHEYISDLSKFQLSGERVLETTYWKMYKKQGTINAIKGLIELTSGGTVNVRITNKGSMLLYKKGIGIDRDDIDATIKKVMKLAKAHNHISRF